MKLIHAFTLSALLLCSMPACAAFKAAETKYGESIKHDLKTVSLDIIEATEITAAEIALTAAREKLAAFEMSAIPPNTGTGYILTRSLAIASARGLVNLAQGRLDKLKAKRTPSGKAPLENVNPVSTMGGAEWRDWRMCARNGDDSPLA